MNRSGCAPMNQRAVGGPPSATGGVVGAPTAAVTSASVAPIVMRATKSATVAGGSTGPGGLGGVGGGVGTTGGAAGGGWIGTTTDPPEHPHAAKMVAVASATSRQAR